MVILSCSRTLTRRPSSPQTDGLSRVSSKYVPLVRARDLVFVSSDANYFVRYVLLIELVVQHVVHHFPQELVGDALGFPQ